MNRLTRFCLTNLIVYALLGCGPTQERFYFEKIDEIPLQLEKGDLVCNIFDLTLDEHGNFYLADRTCPTVWVVDEKGKKLLRIGGEGLRGPGDLSAPMSVAVSGDTLAILEAGNHRISFFSRNGDYLSSFPLRAGGLLSGIEIGPNDTIIVSESLGIRNFDFYTISGQLVSNDNVKTTSSIFAPVRLPGGHMSLSSDGNILYSYVREYNVVKLNWRGEELANFHANPPGYQAPDLTSMENSMKQSHWSFVGLPLQINNLILVQWFRRRVQVDNQNEVVLDRFADLFTLQGKPIQLAIPIPNVFLLAKNGRLYGINTEPVRTGATNPSIVVYRLVPVQKG